MVSDLSEWIKERRAIHDAATEGPWAVDGPAQAGPDDSLVVYPKNDAGAIAYVQPAWDDADSIVDAHNNLLTLLAAVENVLELHKPVERRKWWARRWEKKTVCEECTSMVNKLAEWEHEETEVEYPCPTVRAIEGAINE